MQSEKSSGCASAETHSPDREVKIIHHKRELYRKTRPIGTRNTMNGIENEPIIDDGEDFSINQVPWMAL